MNQVKELFEKINKIRIEYPRFKKIYDSIAFAHEYSRISADPECVMIIGPSGMGKSTISKLYASKFPSRTDDGSIEIPILLTRIPAPATVKSMVSRMLQALGDPFATRGTIPEQTDRLIKLLKDCKVELIMLDEFQHFIDLENRKILYNVSNWLKTLIDDTKIPVVLFGLPECEEILKSNRQLSRRFSNRHRLYPFKWDSIQNINEFRTFLKVLEEQLPFSQATSLSEGMMSSRIFYATEGIVGYVMKLIRRASFVALKKNQCIDKEILAFVYDEIMKEEKPERINPFLSDDFVRPTSSDEQLNPVVSGISNRLNNRKKKSERIFS